VTDWHAEVGRPKRFIRVSIWIAAVVLSLGLNWMGALQLESMLHSEHSFSPRDRSENRALDIRVIPFEERFVEANPEVPSNPPDETTNFGARDQQAAEPEADPSSDGELPQRESEVDSQTFVERGEAQKPLSPGVYSEAATATQPSETTQGTLGELAPAAQRETPDWMENAPDMDGVTVPESREGEKDRKQAERTPGVLVLTDAESTVSSEQTARSVNNPEARPLPRKKVGADVLLAPLARSDRSAPRRGQVAVDSRLTDYGDYTQRALEAIQAEWHQLIREVSVDAGSRFSSVEVTFVLNDEGTITEAKIVESTGGELASLICLDAIYARSPYGQWTEDMRKVLGDSEEVTITFRY